jgi:3',5'-nucleoside bisphosphate phosphatase
MRWAWASHTARDGVWSYDDDVRIDLHIHSTASDGSLSPAAVVTAARAGRLDIIAIADHDTIGGVTEAQQQAVGLVHVIPALELSTWHAGAEFHVLGYYVDTANELLLHHSSRAGGARETRMRDMLDRLAVLGINVAFDDVLAAAGPRPESLGRPHLARALVNRGYVATVADAFDRYIGDQGPGFVPGALISPFQAIDLIHAAGGVAVWAHPRPDALIAMLPELAAHGIDGVECYRPRLTHGEMERIATTARAAGLFVTGGSDWHGEWQGPLGDFAVDRDDITRFLEIGGI